MLYIANWCAAIQNKIEQYHFVLHQQPLKMGFQRQYLKWFNLTSKYNIITIQITLNKTYN